MSVGRPVPLIILLGPPASGKTTLGRRIAAELQFPFYSRDDFKELLFDSLGWSDRDWSKRLGMASWAIFRHVIECQLLAGQPTIVETNFQHPRDTRRFQELATRAPFSPIQVNCHADGQVLTARNRQRALSGDRHPGHVDQLETVQAEIAEQLLKGRFEPLALGGPVIEVDTTDFAAVDEAALVATLRDILHSR